MLALLQREPKQVGWLLTTGAVGGRAHGGVDVELAAVDLALDPAPARLQQRELLVQPARGAAKVLG
ncbi:hypothetical protein SDC9_195565 [bioreactor metagenome]|uniref:Uncharacterized protein n=1 Tax=bioreactor metagenome TaxID=1076179 RepID=A0A645I9F3_9ZZZZ